MKFKSGDIITPTHYPRSLLLRVEETSVTSYMLKWIHPPKERHTFNSDAPFTHSNYRRLTIEESALFRVLYG